MNNDRPVKPTKIKDNCMAVGLGWTDCHTMPLILGFFKYLDPAVLLNLARTFRDGVHLSGCRNFGIEVTQSMFVVVVVVVVVVLHLFRFVSGFFSSSSFLLRASCFGRRSFVIKSYEQETKASHYLTLLCLCDLVSWDFAAALSWSFPFLPD